MEKDRPKRPHDVNALAAELVAEATSEADPEADAATDPATGDERDPAAVALGRRGGEKGGKARAAKMTPDERSEAARRAVQARWQKSS